MAQRRIGQEQLGISADRRQGGASLDALAGVIDGQAIAALLAPLYPAAKGEPAWPPLAMFQAMRLAVWYDLSDVKLAEALADRAFLSPVLRLLWHRGNAGTDVLRSLPPRAGGARSRPRSVRSRGGGTSVEGDYGEEGHSRRCHDHRLRQ